MTFQQQRNLDSLKLQTNIQTHWSLPLSPPSSHQSELVSSLETLETSAQLKKDGEHQTTGTSELERTGTFLEDWELARLSVRELNQKLAVGHDRSVVSALKQKRRTLKNRGYALNCRTKRLKNQQNLEVENVRLREVVEKQVKLLADYERKLGIASSASKPSTRNGEDGPQEWQMPEKDVDIGIEQIGTIRKEVQDATIATGLTVNGKSTAMDGSQLLYRPNCASIPPQQPHFLCSPLHVGPSSVHIYQQQEEEMPTRICCPVYSHSFGECSSSGHFWQLH